MRNLVLILIAHIDNLDVEGGIIKGTLHFLHRHLVRICIGCSRWRQNATKLLLIDELLNGRILAAYGALRITPELQLAELHVQGVKKQ